MSLNINKYVTVSLDDTLEIPSIYIQHSFNTVIKLFYPSSNPCSSLPFTIQFKPGKYLFELFGSAGAGSAGGKGGSTKGIIEFTSTETLYFYIGTKGSNGCMASGGGGIGKPNSGGGSTDVCINKSDDPYDVNSLRSRIMVAGGGGGSNDYDYTNNCKGGCGGGINGGDSELPYYYDTKIQANLTIGATQTTGGIAIQTLSGSEEQGSNGEFGKGGNSIGSSQYTAGGGGDYYGGASANDGDTSVSSGSGGSSFISGMSGCNAIYKNGTHSGKAIHYSGYYFKNAETKSCVNPSEGYAIIEILSPIKCTCSKNDLFLQLKVYLYIMIFKTN